MTPEASQQDNLINQCEALMDDIFARCSENAPNFDVKESCLKDSFKKTLNKFLFSSAEDLPSVEETKSFLNAIHHDDLFLTLACSNGNERAWWEFDQQHRAYMERVARHLASTEIDAQDVIDTVYVELYGTRVVDGERASKFASYSGRGSLRGWLRTVIWHSLVDLHRASHDEVSLDEMTENVGEGMTHANFAKNDLGGENEMMDHLTYSNYRKATLVSIETAFSLLEPHEKLLLLYYHVENMKLREIARMVEPSDSPLRNWFQRKSAAREKDPTSRIHESTIMRWLEKTYGKVLELFTNELVDKHKLNNDEIEICMELATKDLASPNIYRNLMTT